jgi:glycine/D-amino acid oxidase-like deaminating enzyme
VIGADPVRPGLFHVAGLGGFGVGTSWAVGELAADAIEGRARNDELARASSPAREALVAIVPSR